LRQASERLVTVMFVDVRGYTARSARDAPHELADKVATLQRWAKHEIERHHGLIDKFAGDAVMATFNVSGLRLDHALHALQAAIAIRDKAAYAGLPVGIGITVGPAIVGQLATGANVTVVGETTNLAARLQTQAAAGEILLSEEAYRRVRPWIEDQHLTTQEETMTLKGFAQPVTARRVPAPVRTVHED
jgi:adenylate cyclase